MQNLIKENKRRKNPPILTFYLSSVVLPISHLIPDVDDVKFVINFDYPTTSEDYIHRIGRTGRSNNTGTAYTFFTPQNAARARELVDVLREAKQVINPKLLEMTTGRFRGRGKSILCVSRRDILSILPLSSLHQTTSTSTRATRANVAPVPTIAAECTAVGRTPAPGPARPGRALVPRRRASPSGTFTARSAAASPVTVDAAGVAARHVARRRHVQAAKRAAVPRADLRHHGAMSDPRGMNAADAATIEADEEPIGNHRRRHGPPEVDRQLGAPPNGSATDGADRRVCASTGAAAAAAIVAAGAGAAAAAVREGSVRTPKTAATGPAIDTERRSRRRDVILLDSQKYPNSRTIPKHAFIVMCSTSQTPTTTPLYSAKQMVFNLNSLSINLLKLIFYA